MVDWGRVIAITFTGLTVVFIALILLIFIIWLMGRILSLTQKKKDKPDAAQKVSRKASSSPPPQKESSDGSIDSQTLCVIAAAVSAALGEGKSFVLRKVSKSRPSRSVWNMAGTSENTRPFSS